MELYCHYESFAFQRERVEDEEKRNMLLEEHCLHYTVTRYHWSLIYYVRVPRYRPIGQSILTPRGYIVDDVYYEVVESSLEFDWNSKEFKYVAPRIVSTMRMTDPNYDPMVEYLKLSSLPRDILGLVESFYWLEIGGWDYRIKRCDENALEAIRLHDPCAYLKDERVYARVQGFKLCPTAYVMINDCRLIDTHGTVHLVHPVQVLIKRKTAEVVVQSATIQPLLLDANGDEEYEKQRDSCMCGTMTGKKQAIEFCCRLPLEN